ncbi:hypothetical protein [Leuconostoc sp. MTCC 10508]|uniref:hypothetical protein n=1 Tax=Leuconostoc sp. MTCC 10508 TaxID=2698683 RepID=UPI0020BFBDBA|nr:hypothetical protein [Leuconostoc sp. MTCC 10508]
MNQSLRIVYQRYANKVNIFFESYKIGQAKRSQQIGRLDDEYRLQIPALAKQIHEATGLTIRRLIHYKLLFKVNSHLLTTLISCYWPILCLLNFFSSVAICLSLICFVRYSIIST